MTPRLRPSLDALRWTYGTLARELGVHPSTVRLWDVSERWPPPAGLADWLDRAAAWMRDNPAPR